VNVSDEMYAGFCAMMAVYYIYLFQIVQLDDSTNLPTVIMPSTVSHEHYDEWLKTNDWSPNES